MKSFLKTETKLLTNKSVCNSEQVKQYMNVMNVVDLACRTGVYNIEPSESLFLRNKTQRFAMSKTE